MIQAKEEVNEIADRIDERLIARLIAEDPHRTSTYRLESQLIEHYKRLYYFAKRIAKLAAGVDLANNGETNEATRLENAGG